MLNMIINQSIDIFAGRATFKEHDHDIGQILFFIISVFNDLVMHF